MRQMEVLTKSFFIILMVWVVCVVSTVYFWKDSAQVAELNNSEINELEQYIEKFEKEINDLKRSEKETFIVSDMTVELKNPNKRKSLTIIIEDGKLEQGKKKNENFEFSLCFYLSATGSIVGIIVLFMLGVILINRKDINLNINK